MASSKLLFSGDDWMPSRGYQKLLMQSNDSEGLEAKTVLQHEEVATSFLLRGSKMQTGNEKRIESIHEA